jgi:GntR family transcriptional regulator, transcriptional repressor for pyruvate dehydrogenase complex
MKYDSILMTYPPIGTLGLKLSDRVAHELEGQILRRDLRPGDRLPSAEDLEERLGVSRSVIRDAMRTLAARGLVTIRQGHGMEVAEPSDAVFGEALVLLLMRSEMTMADVLAARAAIETALGPLAARNGAASDWETASAHLTAFSDAVDGQHWELAWAAHAAFHLAFLKAVHLPALEVLLVPMQQITLLSSLPPAIDNKELWDVPAHYPILEALAVGDEQMTRKALEEHFSFIGDPQYAAVQAVPFRDAPSIAEVLAALRSNEERPKGGRKNRPRSPAVSVEGLKIDRLERGVNRGGGAQ